MQENTDRQNESAIQSIPVETVGYYIVEPAETPEPAPLLLGLHGYGQTAAEFLEELRPFAPEEFALAAAQGFNQNTSLRTKKVTFHWMSAFRKQDSIERNNRFLASLIERLQAEGVASKEVFMLGFSQGSSVAWRFAQRHPDRVAGIISFCADLPPDVEANLEPLKNVGSLIAGCPDDPLLPRAKTDHAVEALETAGVPIDVMQFTQGHLLPPELGPEVQAWMRSRLKRESA